MTDFTQQLFDYMGEPTINHIKYNKEIEVDGEKKTVEAIKEEPLTLRNALYYLLLGTDGENKTAEALQERFNLMKQIDEKPEETELTAREKEVIVELLPLRYNVTITGQIMNIL